MSAWHDRKTWSDRFMPEIKRILGEHLIGAAPEADDRERNTDLIVLRMEAVRIACRVRKCAHLRYANEFTIRTNIPSGNKTELSKIIEGWGHYLFYGFADEREQGLTRWILGDLGAFRAWHSRQLVEDWGTLPGQARSNVDGSSDFRAYDWRVIPGFVIAHNHSRAAA